MCGLPDYGMLEEAHDDDDNMPPFHESSSDEYPRVMETNDNDSSSGLESDEEQSLFLPLRGPGLLGGGRRPADWTDLNEEYTAFVSLTGNAPKQNKKALTDEEIREHKLAKKIRTRRKKVGSRLGVPRCCRLDGMSWRNGALGTAACLSVIARMMP